MPGYDHADPPGHFATKKLQFRLRGSSYKQKHVETNHGRKERLTMKGASMIIGVFKLLCRGYLVVALVVALCALIGLSLNHTTSLSRTSSPKRPDAQMPKVLWYCIVKGVSWPQAINDVGFSHQISFMDWLLNRYDPWGGQVLDKIGRGRVRTALVCASLDQRGNWGPPSSSWEVNGDFKSE